ncbi:MAG: PEGA domain-containing protein [Polyangiaceae bacterium]
MRSAPLFVLASTLLVVAMHGSARAEEDPSAREDFVQGTERVRESRWAEALEAFERSAAKRPHPVTSFNIGVCERALGHSTRAEQAFVASLADTSAPLPEPVRRDAEAFLSEVRATVAEALVEVSPGDALLLVDGRPLRRAPSGAWVAGISPGGRAEAVSLGPSPARIVLRADPGPHVILMSKQGFTDAVVRLGLAPGERPGPAPKAVLAQDRLPGRIAVTSAPSGVVTVDGLDVGETPVTVERTPGLHRVKVRKAGFVPYEVELRVEAGQDTSLRAPLRPDSPSVLARPWFWGGLVALVGGAALVTYFVARPEPEVPPANGGGLGWVVAVP